MHVVVIGTGFVGVVTAAVFASFGNQVTGLDIDPQKITKLSQGEVPFHEPQLTEMLQAQLGQGNLHFTTEYAEAIPAAEVIMVAVGTPSAPDGNADLTYVHKACESLAPYLQPGAIVCIKSTVPPGSFTEISKKMKALTDTPFVLASLPEFLREGSAVNDTLHPDRLVIGCTDPTAIETLKQLHEPFQAPLVVVRPESAQMGKYSANAYLAQRITFINQIADLCEENGADVEEVTHVIGYDKRIGNHYWYPGLGYGGSCFPKDVKELAAYSRSVGQGYNLFNKIDELNENRIFIKMKEYEQLVGGWEGKRVAVLGLSFKPHTDDLRVAPSTKVIPHLLHEGAQVLAYDPLAIPAFQQWLGQPEGLEYASSVAAACTEADVILLLIEWPELIEYPYGDLPDRTNGQPRWMIDTRNQLDPQQFTSEMWQYKSTGRTYDRER